MPAAGPRLVCWNDHKHDLTNAAHAQLGSHEQVDIVVPVVFSLEAEAMVRRSTRAHHPQAPLRLKFDPALVEHVDFDEILGNAVRVAAEEKRRMAEEGMADEEQLPAAWKVVVTCPYEKCGSANVFDSGGYAQAMAGGRNLLVGAPSSVSDDVWVEAAKEISPAKSLEHASGTSKYVIANISLVALIVGGFGIFSDIGGGFDQHPVLFSFTAVFAALALLTAVISLFPLVSSDLDYDNLVTVQRAYKNVIWFRAVGAILATGFLVVALVLALVAFLVPRAATSPTIAITTSVDRSAATHVVDISVDANHLPNRGRATVTVSRVSGSGTPKRISSGNTVAGKEGEAKLELKFAEPTQTKTHYRYVIDAKVTSASGNLLRSQSTTFSSPPTG